MQQNVVQAEIIVKGINVRVIRSNGQEYISLTDLARCANPEEPKLPIYAWMRNKDVILYLGLWERLNNAAFKGHEFETFAAQAGRNSFYMSPQKWVKATNATGILSKAGNNGGTFAHSDIALEFASWLSPEFKLYLITEFERLKKDEAYRERLDWQANRILSKLNYLIQTDAIKEFIVPTLTEQQKHFVYAEEADVINVALFGTTAKAWRLANPEKAKHGNIRDYTDLLHLAILNNLQNANALMISEGMPQSERLEKLNALARQQAQQFQNNPTLNKLETLQYSQNQKQSPKMLN